MPTNFALQHTAAHRASDRSDPWGDLRRYEQAKADGTAPEASFDDLLDVINPLQHIPVVSTIYREITGDTIQGAARIMGGGLYGGVGGFVGGLVNAIAEEATGRDLGDHVMVALGLSDDMPADGTTPAENVQVADAAGTADTGSASATAAGPDAEARSSAATSTRESNTAVPPYPAATESRPASEDAALAGGGALTGLAALKAFAHDTGQAAAAAQADRTAASRASAEIHASQQASVPADRAAPTGERGAAAMPGPANAPSQFMALGDRGKLINHRARTNQATLAAESDPLGHRRLQGDPRAVPTPSTTAQGAAQRPTRAAEATPTSATEGPTSAASAARGDLAERMMRALSKYEAMRQDD